MTYSPLKFNKVNYYVDYVPKILKYYKENVFSWNKIENMKILDIGTGPGHTLLEKVVPIFPNNYKKILGTDKFEEMVNFFNSIPKDPRITGITLDIETKNFPNELKEKFNFVFSSYCLHYVKNFDTALINVEKSMKPNGELLFIWLKKNHFYDAYKILSETEKWKTYTSDFKDWKTYFDHDKPLDFIKTVFEKHNLKILKSEQLDYFLYDTDPKNFHEPVDALDFISKRIPKCDYQEYKNVYRKLALNDLITLETEENGYKAKLPFSTLVVGAKKV